jgi:hypothetical protein
MVVAAEAFSIQRMSVHVLVRVAVMGDVRVYF